MAKKTLIYKNRNADLRVLNKKDLVSVGLDEGVEFKHTEFWLDQEVEVDAAVADLLLSHDEFAGEFKEAESAVPADRQASVKQK